MESYSQVENVEQFKPLSFWRRLFLSRDDLAEYYKLERKYLHEKGESLRGLGWRKKLQPILLKLIELDRKVINRQSLRVLKDESVDTDKPVIYAITHMGKFDYQIVSEVIKKHQIPFSGDPETMHRTLDGVLLGLNGIIYCDTDDKEDRKIATDTSIELLKSGNNLLIYPEGVWNVSSNLLMLPLFPGIIRMALETGCEIVPVAVEQYDKDFVVNIGKNFKVEEMLFETKEEEKDYIDSKKEELRDEMATLKWEIFESMPMQVRKELGDYASENRRFVDTRLYEWFNKKENRPFYDDETIERRTFRAKNVVLSKEAFSFFGKMKLNKKNAFLYAKRLEFPDEINDMIEKELEGNTEKVR